MKKLIQKLRRLLAQTSLALASLILLASPAFAFTQKDFTESLYGHNDSVETLASFEIAKQLPVLENKAMWEFGLEYEGSVRKLTDNNKVIYKNKLIF